MKYLSYCRNLKFEERPQYSEMRNMFKELFQKNDFKFDCQYDWVIKDEKKSSIKKQEDLPTDKAKKA